jgi:23S rRNA pseudouridine1911/1915/1917 synthase
LSSASGSSPRREPHLATPWLSAAFNRGHIYRDRVSAPALSTVAFYASRYPHSDRAVWEERLIAGEILRNGQRLRADGPLVAGDRLAWHRPPWQEAAVPVLQKHAIVFDDGDLLVLNKPSGLPVLPAGGFLEHTLLAQLEGWLAAGVITANSDNAGSPRPVHRLGRFTSGLLVCARSSASRAWLSALLRDSSRHLGVGVPASPSAPLRCHKRYRALTQPLPADWAIAETRELTTPIGLRSHPRLGRIWCAVPPDESAALPSRSDLTLLERRPGSCLVAVAIATGRPHQIRIHTAALGAPLLGDPLYRPGGTAHPEALPGDGGYQLHAHRLSLTGPDGRRLELEAPLPPLLERGACGGVSADQAFSKASRREK